MRVQSLPPGTAKDTAAAARIAVDAQTQRGQEKLEGSFSWYGETYLPDSMGLHLMQAKEQNKLQWISWIRMCGPRVDWRE